MVQESDAAAVSAVDAVFGAAWHCRVADEWAIGWTDEEGVGPRAFERSALYPEGRLLEELLEAPTASDASPLEVGHAHIQVGVSVACHAYAGERHEPACETKCLGVSAVYRVAFAEKCCAPGAS